MPLDRRRLLASLPLAWTAVLASPAWPSPRVATGRARRSGGRPQSGVEAVVLGTAQDGGVPQVNCFTGHCARVRAGQAAPPLVACLGLRDARTGQRFLIDATPDFPRQVGALLAPGGEPPAAIANATVPLHEHLHGILLTHAHIGHYAGLVHLSNEVAAPRGLSLWASAAMTEYLRANAPWEMLFRVGFVESHTAVPGERIQLTDDLAVTPFQVVHRPEYSDTLGYLIHGPDRTLMYVPDADVWDGWPTPFEQLLRDADVALIDGSFWSHEELGHRVQANVAHPPVAETIERLEPLADRPVIWFTHLNHTNPLWNPDAGQHDELPDGFGVALTGQRLPL